MRVAILGTGYVGLTTGVCFAWLGHDVVCLDTNEEKVASLLAGKIPIYEPGLAELLDASRARLQFTCNYSEAVPQADVVIIAVGTPPSPDGSPDLRYLRAASEQVGRCLEGDFTVVVNKSTVPIGSGNWVESLIRGAYEKQN
ncbi:MAG TPA: 3-hydroxyacyl-CoA dehydrogenase NAD-binding domain-containing protein, partial [Bryobacteraceae bacterium]|nr:3-hydroxyacyl-CoA dehydrogenase NAD-binding domain-containing protein [Bryobacteraceae bacterium]